jgi:hypothetical protein
MTALIDKIISIYPSLTYDDFTPRLRTVMLGDQGSGPVIIEWNYSQPQPTQAQLDAIP